MPAAEFDSNNGFRDLFQVFYHILILMSMTRYSSIVHFNEVKINFGFA